MTEPELGRIALFDGIPWAAVPEVWGAAARTVDGPVEVAAGKAAILAVLAGVLLRHVDGRVERFGSGELVGLELFVEDDPRERSIWTAGPAQWVELPTPALRAVGDRVPALQRNAWRALVSRTRELERALSRANEELDDTRRQAQHDGLTHAFNRRWLDENLPRLLSRSSPERPLSVVMVDIDHFKRLNDTLGHAAGDRVLLAVADTLRRRFRPADLVVRYGGEEFAVLMPATTTEAAARAAERVREAVAFTRFAGSDGTALPGVTVSCGIATARDGDRAETLVHRADTALYRAKATGRNRVVSVGSDRPE